MSLPGCGGEATGAMNFLACLLLEGLDKITRRHQSARVWERDLTAGCPYARNLLATSTVQRSRQMGQLYRLRQQSCSPGWRRHNRPLQQFIIDIISQKEEYEC